MSVDLKLRHRRERSIAAGIILAIIGIMLIFAYCPYGAVPTDIPTPLPSEFGTQTIGGSMEARVTPIFPRRAFTTAAVAPYYEVRDNFENTTLNSMWTLDGTSHANIGYLSDRSIKFGSALGNQTLDGNVNIPTAIDTSYKINLRVNVSRSLQINIGGESEYFAVVVSFASTQLVYTVTGQYNDPENDTLQVISLSGNMNYNVWVGFQIAMIQDDYYHQFNATIPTIQGIDFVLHTMDTDLDVYLDDVDLVLSPIEYSNESYWRYNDAGDRLYAWAVDIIYNVTINETVINAANVWLEVNIFGTILDDEGNVIRESNFLQYEILQVTQFNTTLTWLGQVYEAPLHAGDLERDYLQYNYTAHLVVVGQRLIDPTKWSSAEADDTESIEMWWVYVSDGDIQIEVYAIGGISTVMIGATAVSYRRSKKRNKVVHEKEDMFN